MAARREGCEEEGDEEGLFVEDDVDGIAVEPSCSPMERRRRVLRVWSRGGGGRI